MLMPEIERSLDRLRPAYQLYRWVWASLDLFFPPQCGGCGAPGARWCSSCQQRVEIIYLPVCEKCGQHSETGSRCVSCLDNPPDYTALRSYAVYSGELRKAIHRLKYEGDMALAEVLARPMIQLLNSTTWSIDLVAPVPIGSARRRQRGYNQAALLAWPLALSCSLSYRPHSLKRKRETRSQVGLTGDERRTNVSGAFSSSASIVKGKSILVVDDVTTSGATIEACTQTLLANGAKQVFGLTLARTAYAPDDRDDF
jgi:competence protein ComFC